MFSLAADQPLPLGNWAENSLGFASSFVIAAITGGMFAAPVTLAVLPIVRCLRPGRDKMSFFVLAFSGLIFGFLSPVVIGIVMISRKGFSMDEWLLLGSMGAGSGLIMAVAWFFLTQPPKTRPPKGAVVPG
jgi:hypothetical protein